MTVKLSMKCLFVLCLVIPVRLINLDDVIAKKNQLFQEEFDNSVGSDIVLNDNEQKANDVIMELKNQVLSEGFQHPEMFNVSSHFFNYKDLVKKTPLYKIIQKMPKGAVLHAHDTGLLSPDYVLNITYLDNLYVCFVDGFVDLRFSRNVPQSPCTTNWQLMKTAREESGNIKKFDAKLRKYFTIVTKNPNQAYTNINEVWQKFSEYFIVSTPLLSYKPVWKKYFYDTLKAYREDGVMFMEIRSVLPELYDLDGNIYDALTTVEVCKNALDQFMEDYPDFYGAKIIYAPIRQINNEELKNNLQTAIKIKQTYPTFFAGFDLVGQEDLGVPLKEFLPLLSEWSDDLDYFFHAGETNWNGLSSDENLFDAIALKTKRIGHAFAIAKHPVLMEEIKKMDIAIEANVISNMVLKLVEDPRNHPLAGFIAQGLPVVISSDDPGVWEADPMSHDYYVTFVAVASAHSDIRLLKRLALNSLYYSTISDKDKIAHEFEIRWVKFINSLIEY